jgi:hypothetical protein
MASWPRFSTLPLKITKIKEVSIYHLFDHRIIQVLLATSCGSTIFKAVYPKSLADFGKGLCWPFQI